MLLALIMATLTLGLLFSGWLTPTPGKAQQDPPNPTPNQENCAASTNVLSGTPPSVVTNSSVSPTSIIVCYSNAPIMPTTIIAPAYSTNNIYTLAITDTNCNTTTNTENVTYAVSGVFWTNITAAPYTNFPANVTSSFTADADVFVTSSDTNICSSPGLVNLATVSWYSIQVTVDAPDYDPDAMSSDAMSPSVSSSDSCGCGLGDATIWWFNGEDLTSYGYTMKTKATVTGAPSGATIAWTVTAPAIYTGSGSTITITATNFSAEHGVTITATISGTEVCKQYLTVLAPHSLEHLPAPDGDVDSAIANVGGGSSAIAYQSIITDKILDNLGHMLPLLVPMNEDIDGDGKYSDGPTLTGESVWDYPFNPKGWPWGLIVGQGGEIGGDANPKKCFDTIARAADDGTWIPPCLNPQNPPRATVINHLKGFIYIGSKAIAKGVKVQNLTWQIYVDHGRHENVSTP